MNTTRLSLTGLWTLVLISAGLMLHDNGWLGYTSGLQTPPAFHTHPGRWGLVLLSSLQVGFSLSLLYRSWSPPRAFLFSLLSAALLLPYFIFIREADGRIPITELDQVFLILGALCLSVFLIGYFFKKKGLGRVPHLLTGVWSLGIFVIQVLFHFTLLFPGATLDANASRNTLELLTSIESPHTLNILIEKGVVSLVELPLDAPDEIERILSENGVARSNDVLTPLNNLLKERPDATYGWMVAGPKDVDVPFVFYDANSKKAWLSPTPAFTQTRLMVMRAYLGGMALFTLIWTGGLILLNQIHTRRMSIKK
jgi:hypothetical protein